MFALSSPSGAGKSTLAGRLMAQDREISMSVSVTTRSPRPGEVEGEHYYFVDQPHFDTMVAQDSLLEWAEVHGNCYGTPKEKVQELTMKGRDVLFDVDWQGAAQIYEKVGTALVRIFILPPSLDALRTRLTGRGQDAPDVIVRRLAGAKAEIAHWQEYDYVIINDDLDRAYTQLHAIITAERLRRFRRPGLVHFIDQMLA